MATFFRGKQAGMQNDLSANIIPGSFAPDDRARYGINSQISCIAYEPIQSLLALGTNESKFGSGRIYVFGQTRVQKLLVPSRSCSFADIQFCANRLVSLDTKNEVSIWNLDTGKRITGFRTPGVVSCMLTDPVLDWCFLGMQTGEICAYDLDRERMSPFRLPNFWTEKDPKTKAVALVSMQLHPRDIGKLLIAYTHGVVIYSFKQNIPNKFFEYQVPPGAPGGSGTMVESMRRPKVTHALWHPTGTFILTAHDDGSLVFWDAKDGRVVMARTFFESNVDQPVPNPGASAPKHPYVRIAWCCKQNPEDSGLLIAGGQKLDEPSNGLTFIDLGVTPNYATSSWQILSEYTKGKRTNALETPPGVEITNFFLIPRLSPHFAGAQDPIAVMTLLASGELLTLSFPSGYPISPTNQLHPSVSFVHPFATKFAVTTLDRGRWLGMVEKRSQGEPLLKGGAQAPHPLRKFEGRTIIQVAHADSTIRIWDVGHGDEIENPSQLQVDIARALNRYEDVEITAMTLASTTGEFAAGTNKGEVVIYRWDGNKYFGDPPDQNVASNPGGISDISVRAEPSLKSGLMPYSLYEMMQGPISAIKLSDAGFLAVGSENGFISIIDLRGPSIMFQASMASFIKQEKRSSFLRSRSSVSASKEWLVVLEFGVMTLDDDKYSSICCFAGTNLGKVITFKILPSGSGYNAALAGVANCNDRVVSICPIIADTGKPALATAHAVAGLREGKHVNGLLVVVTQSEARIFKPATAKGASKSFDDYLCDAATVTEYELHGMALVGVFGDRITRAFSLPGLKELGSYPLPMMDGSRSSNSAITEDGEIFCWTGPSELAVLQVWGSGEEIENTADKLINPDLEVPPRPTISNVQWISGTQYVSPADLDLLIGGPDRPASKRMMSATAAIDRNLEPGPNSGYTGTGSQEGWGEYLTRQLNERTEKLNIVNDSMDSAAEASQKWADDVGKLVNQQKRKMVFGSITSKFA
ncbi:lethal giant larvae like, C-terminal-domain-containing protein [Annulohypoxylon truncatum]|uniref:lethal giant larvae like, C-terminal-domain-containing protein n=1 Tax=Annulohypoxylon truncatum TaxID=327061 RepID=UPI002007CFCF|nr:lethal giant larvae like, C-terminal-domain-containing protein [Annulohypoxylon truncatum]KAI1207794.1 lethal giant larvae like, C-terminal-domain-containing protein [Annulohypoxylon truncatum]